MSETLNASGDGRASSKASLEEDARLSVLPAGETQGLLPALLASEVAEGNEPRMRWSGWGLGGCDWGWGERI